jgi:hypothetical protein
MSDEPDRPLKRAHGPPEKPLRKAIDRFGEKAFKKLVEGIHDGLTITAASKRTGFSRATVYSYLGKRPDKLDELKKEFEAVWLSKVQEVGHRDWKAFAWLLERNYPSRYALFTVQRQEVTGSMAHDHRVGIVTESELVEMARIAAEIAAQAPTATASIEGNGNHLGNGNGDHSNGNGQDQ